VPPFEILDRTSKKVIDGGQGISYYWVGKNKAATLFSATPAGIVGMTRWTSWAGSMKAAAWEMWQELYQKEMKLNVIAFPLMPASPQALGWFKKPIQSVEDFKG
jgi:TRAP-type mannitol/chloroaromatic compound transport system substrate-binding protein